MGSKPSKPPQPPQPPQPSQPPQPEQPRQGYLPPMEFLCTGPCPGGLVGLEMEMEVGCVSAALCYDPFAEDLHYCEFKFHQIHAATETFTVVVATVSHIDNPESPNIASSSNRLFEKWLHILSKDERLTGARIEYYFSKVQDEVSALVKERMEHLEQTVNLEEEEDSDWDETSYKINAHRERKRLRNLRQLKGIHTCVPCTSTVVIIGEERTFVAGPGSLVTAIGSTSGCRVVSMPAAEHSKVDDAKVCEFEGGLKPDELLVLFMKTSEAHLSAVQTMPVCAAEDVVDICKKLGALDSSEEAAVYVLKIERTGSSGFEA